MNSETSELSEEQFSKEIESFRRVNERLKSFLSWMTTVALASVAFMFTLLLQLKTGSSVPYPVLAGAALVLLLWATGLGLLNRFIYEFSYLYSDLNSGTSLLKKIVELAQRSGSLTESEEAWIGQWLTSLKDGAFSEIEPAPYILKLITSQAIATVIGVVALCGYLVTFLFWGGGR